jgi:phage-related protein
LKLGYGGTKEEMARLIADTAEMTDIQDKLGVSVDASDMSFGNIINAISVMQEKLHITGTTTEEAAKTMEGSMKSMQASWHNLLGNIATGGDLTGPLTQLGATAATFVTRNLIPMIGNILSALPQALGTVLMQIAETLPNILNTLLTSLGELMKGLGDFDWAGLISTVIDSITTFFEGDGLSNFLIMGFQATASLAQGLIENLPKIIDSITNLIDSLVTWISDHLDEIIAAGVQIIVALSVGLLKAVPKLLEAVPKLVGAIGGSILEVDWIGVGIDIVRGIISGIQSMGSALWQAMKDIAKSCYQSVLDFFSIGSPSRLMRDTVGVMIPAGMAIGIDNGADLAVGAIEDMNDEVYGAISLPDYGAIGYSTDYTPAGVASSEPTMAGEYSETSMQPINVYIGQDKLDTVLAKANARMTYRAGR